MEIASWGGHRFEVRPGLIRSFTEMTLRGSAEIEEKVSDNQKYVERKAGNGWELTITAVLSAYLGCSVREEALEFANDAKDSRAEYFYMAGKKLVPEKLMLTEASVQDVEIAPNGQWVRANVQLVFKQAERGEGGGTGTASNSTGTKKTGSCTTSTAPTATAVTAATRIRSALTLIPELTSASGQAAEHTGILLRWHGISATTLTVWETAAAESSTVHSHGRR